MGFLWFTIRAVESVEGYNLTVGEPPVASGRFSCPKDDGAAATNRCLYHDIVFGTGWEATLAMMAATSAPYTLYDNSSAVVSRGYLIKSGCKLN